MRRTAARLAVLAAAALVLGGCGSVGVGLAANNQGAAVGLSTGIGLPTVNAPRDRRQAPPPPRLVDPSATDAGPDTRKATP
ncbi:MAG: hypothetical protein REJ24_21095 [Rhodocyclaceae bacterium]|nr:hypothetical protein [Pseudomonadota bacterium]MDQ7975087.1 hypothetical protein [Rhodocyclaceae bacterium]MDQ8002866.1 hypothetical protein [Pseudomonadota bacterium]MDQ8020101.1 hypothetical protein [Pseudomonadota bacterium]